MKFGKKQVFIFGLTLAVILGGCFYYFQISNVNYLIPGVSYNGIYNLFFQSASLPEISSILDILGYWGDERFAIPDLRQEFSSTMFATTTVSSKTLKSEIQSFFTENGYETSGWLSVEPTGAIKKIKQFVNSKKKTPVIVLTKRTLDEKNNIFLFIPQVVIGVFDSSQKVIVHDHYYGNNYEISYGDFEKTFQAVSGILAAWPSNEIKGLIKEPNYNLAYPQRLESMDKAGALLATKYLLALRLWRIGFSEQSIAVYKEFFNDPNFKYLPPAFQVMQLSHFAELNINLNQLDEVIKIINEQVLPLDKNLSQMSQGWIVPFDECFYPHFVLSFAYLKKGERDLAIDSYKEFVRIRDLTIEKIGNESNTLTLFRIDELEKAISSQK